MRRRRRDLPAGEFGGPSFGQASASRGAHDARRYLQLVHRGLRHHRPERRQGAARWIERV